MTKNKYNEEEEYALEIEQWIRGVEQAISFARDGKELTTFHKRCLDDALESLSNTFSSELELACTLIENNEG